VEAVSVDVVERIEVLHAEFAVETELGPLTGHPALLAGDRHQVLVVVRHDGARKGDIE